MYKPLGIDLGASKVAITSADGHPPVVELPPKLPADPVSVSVGGAISDLAVTAEGGEEALASAFRDGIAGPLTGITIASAISRYLGEDALGHADVLLSIPCSFGEMEEVALAEMAVAAGARDAYLVYAPLAAVVGNGLDPSTDAILVDVGASRTNILVVACGRIIAKRTHPIGGDSFDAAIVEYVRKRHNVEISLKAAEAVKKQVGTVWVGNEKRSAETYGRDLSNGDYCTVRITSEEMFTALEEPMAALIEVVCAAITKIPPDHVREVFDTGILLTGGGCLLEGLDKMISGVTGVNATCLREPTTAVVSGLARLLEWTQGNRGRIGTRNISKYIMKPATESQRGKKV